MYSVNKLLEYASAFIPEVGSIYLSQTAEPYLMRSDCNKEKMQHLTSWDTLVIFIRRT